MLFNDIITCKTMIRRIDPTSLSPLESLVDTHKLLIFVDDLICRAARASIVSDRTRPSMYWTRNSVPIDGIIRIFLVQIMILNLPLSSLQQNVSFLIDRNQSAFNRVVATLSAARNSEDRNVRLLVIHLLEHADLHIGSLSILLSLDKKATKKCIDIVILNLDKNNYLTTRARHVANWTTSRDGCD